MSFNDQTPARRPDDANRKAFDAAHLRVKQLKCELDEAKNTLECMEINCKHVYEDGTTALYEGWVFNFCDVCGAAKGLNKTQYPNAVGLDPRKKEQKTK